MKLRLKIVLITSLVAALIILFASLLADNIIISGFVNVENARVVKDVERVTDALVEKVRAVDTLNRDYATWDSTYYAMEKPSSSYDEGDLSGILSISKFDFAILMRNDGTIMYAKEAFSGKETDYDPATADLDARNVYSYIQKNYASLVIDNRSKYFNGLIQLPSGLAIISSRPIIMTNGSGEIHGTIIIGEMLDTSFIEKMSNQTHMTFSFQSYDSITYETKLKLNVIFGNETDNEKTKNRLGITGNIVNDKVEFSEETASGITVQIFSVNKSEISGNILLNDIFGKPVALLEITELRTVYLEGISSVRYTIQVLIVAAILFIIMEYFFFNKYIVSRLVSMERQMKEIHSKKLTSSRITVTGSDELSSFGEVVNATLDVIEKVIVEKQAVFDADPDSYFYVNSAWKIIDYKLMESSKGIIRRKDTDSLKNLYLSSLLNSTTMNKLSQARLESEKSKKPVISEINIIMEGAANGAARIFEARVVAVDNISSDKKMYLILFDDITERKRFEQQLLEKNKDLEKFNKFAIDRELRMSDLKKELRNLKSQKDVKDAKG